MNRTSLRRKRPFAFLVFLGVFVLSSAWALSMPLAAGPDEPAHIIKAASVVRGELLGEPTNDPAVTRVQVPAPLADANEWHCFAYEPSISAACQQPPSAEVGERSALTSAGLYNPTYYLLVGWPTLLEQGPIVMVMGMRILTALLSAVLLASVFSVMSRMMSSLAALTVLAVAATPMVFFLNAIVNPNGLEILGGAAFLTGLLWFVSAPNVRGKVALLPAVMIAVGGFLGGNARGVSPFWMFLFGVLFLIAVSRDRLKELLRAPGFLVGLAVAIVGSALGVAWTLKTGTLTRMGDFPGQDGSPIEMFVRMLLNAPSDPGLIGFFGWLDTPVPGLVYATYGFGIVGIVSLAAIFANRRWRVTLIGAAVVFFAGPAFLQAASLKSSGFIWQGRYSLVALVALLIISGIGLAASARENSLFRQTSARRLSQYLLLVLALLGVAQFWAFYSNLERYAVADGGSPLSVLTAAQWQPPVIGVMGVIVLFAIGAVALTACAAFAARTARLRTVEELCQAEPMTR